MLGEYAPQACSGRWPFLQLWSLWVGWSAPDISVSTRAYLPYLASHSCVAMPSEKHHDGPSGGGGLMVVARSIIFL